MRSPAIVDRVGAVVTAVSVLLAACGGAASPSPSLTAGASGASNPPAASATPAGTINVIAYSGVFYDKYLKAVVEPYMKAHPNVTVNLISSDNSAQMLARLRTEKANQTLDVTIQDLTVAQVGYNENLLQPLDPAVVTNMADLDPQAKFSGNQGAGVTFDASVIVYDPTRVQPAPTSWKDLLDPKFQGQVGAFAPPDLQGLFLLIALDKALGVDYKQGIQPALDALTAASANIQTWKPTPDTYQLITNGAMKLGIGYNARAQVFKDQSNGKLAIAYPSEGVVFQINRINLVAGSKNAAAAQDFINYALSPEAQSAFTTAMFYSPTNTKAAQSLPPDVINRTASAPGIQFIPVDWTFLLQNRDIWAKEFTSKVLGQ